MSDVSDTDIGYLDLAPRADPYKEGYIDPPIPYDESLIPEAERDWIPDYHDQLIPRRRSFISDFVFHTRGIMTPTLASIWSSLLVLQTAIKREAWMKWYPKPIYPNQYIIIIGPAGKVKKTTAIIDIGLPILETFRSYIRDRNIYEMKDLLIVKDKTTPESLVSALLPESRGGTPYYFRNPNGEFQLDANGKPRVYARTSEGLLISSELAVMLTKRSYAESMIEILLDLYDPRDSWDWRREGAGLKRLKKTCTSMVGGTTVDGFRNSIPGAAKGDGFLSRMVMVYVPVSRRRYPMPFLPKGAPDMEEMSRRLAWIAEHTLGEHTLSPEALRIYEKWYKVFSTKMDEEPSMAGAISRMDINVLKTSLLIRAARYGGVPQVIDAEDMMDSIRLVETTYRAVPFLLGQLDDDIILSQTAKAEIFISHNKRISRQRFLSGMRIRSDVASAVIHELIARGEVAVEYNGKQSLVIGERSDEVYVWISTGDVGAGSFESAWADENYQNSWEMLLDQEERGIARRGPHIHTKVSKGKRGRSAAVPRKDGKAAAAASGKASPVGESEPRSEAASECSGDNGSDIVQPGSGSDLPVPTPEEDQGDHKEDT